MLSTISYIQDAARCNAVMLSAHRRPVASNTAKRACASCAFSGWLIVTSLQMHDFAFLICPTGFLCQWRLLDPDSGIAALLPRNWSGWRHFLWSLSFKMRHRCVLPCCWFCCFFICWFCYDSAGPVWPAFVERPLLCVHPDIICTRAVDEQKS